MTTTTWEFCIIYVVFIYVWFFNALFLEFSIFFFIWKLRTSHDDVSSVDFLSSFAITAVKDSRLQELLTPCVIIFFYVDTHVWKPLNDFLLMTNLEGFLKGELLYRNI